MSVVQVKVWSSALQRKFFRWTCGLAWGELGAGRGGNILFYGHVLRDSAPRRWAETQKIGHRCFPKNEIRIYYFFSPREEPKPVRQKQKNT